MRMVKKKNILHCKLLCMVVCIGSLCDVESDREKDGDKSGSNGFMDKRQLGRCSVCFFSPSDSEARLCRDGFHARYQETNLLRQQ